MYRYYECAVSFLLRKLSFVLFLLAWYSCAAVHKAIISHAAAEANWFWQAITTGPKRCLWKCKSNSSFILLFLFFYVYIVFIHPMSMNQNVSNSQTPQRIVTWHVWQAIGINKYDSDEHFWEFGLSFKSQLAKVSARILEPPSVHNTLTSIFFISFPSRLPQIFKHLHSCSTWSMVLVDSIANHISWQCSWKVAMLKEFEKFLFQVGWAECLH